LKKKRFIAKRNKVINKGKNVLVFHFFCDCDLNNIDYMERRKKKRNFIREAFPNDTTMRLMVLKLFIQGGTIT